MVLHIGVRIKHTFYNHRYYHRHGVHALAMFCLLAIAVAVVVNVVKQGGNEVVRSVAADCAAIVQLLVHRLFLQISLNSQGYGASL